MNWRRTAARTIAEISALAGGTKFRQGFRVLIYHSVGSRLRHDSYGISIAPGLFERHMEILATSEQIRLEGFCSRPSSPEVLRVAVTLDDGYKDNLYTAAPILLKFKIPFTIFVTSSFITGRSQDYLTRTELRELSELPGVTIGSHGATHVPFAKCDGATLQKELYGSRAYLEDLIGREVKAISYPYGSVDRRCRDTASRAGYLRGGCSRFDINDETRDPLLLCRCEILSLDSERLFIQKLSGAWDWYRWRNRDPAS